ncbi:hypothetical protein Hanom_Chr15g01414121 [Helianthus anomalus]
MMTTHSMRIPEFFQPSQQGGPSGVGVRFDPDPLFRVFGESSAGATVKEEDNDED